MNFYKKYGLWALVIVFSLLSLLASFPDTTVGARGRDREDSVRDDGQLFSIDEQNTLRDMIESYKQTTDIQIRVITKSRQVYMNIPKFAKQELRDMPHSRSFWGVDFCDCLVLYLSTADREVRLEASGAAKYAIYDDRRQEIIDNLLVPAFRTEDYFKGVYQSLEHLCHDADLMSTSIFRWAGRVEGSILRIFQAMGGDIQQWLLIILFIPFLLPYLAGHQSNNGSDSTYDDYSSGGSHSSSHDSSSDSSGSSGHW